jgi:tetratricopeptide (TPR) repeat protein/tRNA A-37 threonylcarbamoyl transferase component Bud32
MGQVFAAVHESDGQEVALKLLLKEAAEDRQIARRFEQEYNVLARLEHRNIVKVFAWGRPAEGVAYLAMERLDGLSLREWLLRQSRPADVKTALAIGRQIADAMSAVHERRIVHRDLKPDNIMVLNPDTAASTEPIIKVLDFGIAKVPATPTGGVDTQVLTAAGTVLGTLPYMAPEQCLTVEAVDAAVDVYALGVMLFELIAGRLPFASTDATELIAMHFGEERPFLGDLVPEAPPDVSVLIASMFAKQAKERPSMRRCFTRLTELEKELEKSHRSDCPLPGLQPFSEADAELFFGRRGDIVALVNVLKLPRADHARWVLLEGPSGAGKSSLVQAGILPRLRDDRGPDGPRWLIGCFRPSDDPLRALAQALVDALAGNGLEQTLEEVYCALNDNPDALRSLVACAPRGRTVLLVIEQMEELFTLGTGKEASFAARLHAALTDPESSLLLLTTLRTDFFHCLDQVPKLAGLLNRAAFRHYLSPIDEEGLKQVVQGMAQRVGLSLDESLIGRMVRDAAGTGCPLPLLGHTLRALWSPQDGAPSGLRERYEQMDGVGGALSKQADAFLTRQGDEGCERAKWIILSLVQVNRGAPATRRSRSWAEALSAGGADSLAEEVLRRLSGVRLEASPAADSELRLVVLSGRPSQDSSGQRVDLVHETLLREVPIIARWLDRERLRLEQYTDLESAAAIWEQTGCDPADLPTGASLVHFRGSVEDKRRLELLGRMVSEQARRFLEAAEEAERQRRLREQETERAERRQRAIERSMTLALFILAVAAFGLALYAFQQRELAVQQSQIAIQQKEIADKQREIAVQQRNVAEGNLHSFISTINKVVSDIDWELARRAGNGELRDKQLKGIEGALDSLPPSEREKAEVQAMFIKAKHRVGDFALSDGTLKDAENKYVTAREVLQSAGKRESFDGAMNHSKLGKVELARARFNQAETQFNEALRLLKEIGGDDLGSSRTLATSYFERGELDRARGRFENAIPYYNRAIDHFRDIDRNNKDDEDGGKDGYNLSLLAEALGACAGAARQAGEVPLANSLLREAIDIEKPLAEGELSNAYHRAILARIYIELAELRYQEKNLAEAIEHFNDALEYGRGLVKGDPTRKPYALILGDALYGIERLAGDRRDAIGAVKARNERHELADGFLRLDPDDGRFQRLQDLRSPAPAKKISR